MDFFDGLALLVVALLVVAILAAALFWFISSKSYGRRILRRGGGSRGYQRQRSDGYFQSMFPELQPHFHPRKVVQFVRACNARTKSHVREWRSPPGFEQATATIALVEGAEQVRLLDGAGALLAEFAYERGPKGGVLRVGQGEMTVEIQEAQDTHVRYRHPGREFKWSSKGGWQFTTPVAEHPIDSNDGGGTHWSNEHGSVSSGSGSAGRVATVGAAAALVSGAGGAFAGGGASDQWDTRATDGATANGSGTAY